MESATCFSKVKLLTGEEVLWNYLYIQISCFLSSFYFIHFNFIIMDLWFPILSMVYNLSKSVLFWYSDWTWFGPWETLQEGFWVLFSYLKMTQAHHSSPAPGLEAALLKGALTTPVENGCSRAPSVGRAGTAHVCTLNTFTDTCRYQCSVSL